MGKKKKDVPLAENDPAETPHVVKLGSQRVKEQVRDGEF